MNNTKRYMINTNTGVILPYDATVMALGNSHIKECTVDGVIYGAGNTEVDELKAQNAELQFIIDEQKRRIASLESYVLQLEDDKNSGDDVRRRRELEDMTFDDLKKLCAEYGIAAKGNKAALIETILRAESSIKETESK